MKTTYSFVQHRAKKKIETEDQYFLNGSLELTDRAKKLVNYGEQDIDLLMSVCAQEDISILENPALDDKRSTLHLHTNSSSISS